MNFANKFKNIVSGPSATTAVNSATATNTQTIKPAVTTAVKTTPIYKNPALATTQDEAHAISIANAQAAAASGELTNATDLYILIQSGLIR
jgi:hypothetical protein